MSRRAVRPRTTGEKPDLRPVILIHGAFSHGQHCGPLAEQLDAAGFACVAPTLPGHAPSDPRPLTRLGLPDYSAALERVRADCRVPPVIIGHSMGGLLAQHLAATGPCAALICLATAPPGILPAQWQALPLLAPLMPRMLSGLAIQPSAATFRFLALHDLPLAEQDELAQSLGAESGRAYRSMILGTSQVCASRVACPVLCVSGARDRIISRAVAQRTARHYLAEHHILEGRGHWLLARSGIVSIATLVLDWLGRQGLHPTRHAV